MTIEEYIKALERVKAMHVSTGEAISWIMGQLKGDLFKAKKMPQTQLRYN